MLGYSPNILISDEKRQPSQSSTTIHYLLHHLCNTEAFITKPTYCQHVVECKNMANMKGQNTIVALLRHLVESSQLLFSFQNPVNTVIDKNNSISYIKYFATQK